MTQPYDIELAPRARRDLRKLPEKVAVACFKFIDGPLAANPYRVGKPLIGELAGGRSARRGTYRIIYTIHEERRLVEVSHIAHRKSVYRPDQ